MSLEYMNESQMLDYVKKRANELGEQMNQAMEYKKHYDFLDSEIQKLRNQIKERTEFQKKSKSEISRLQKENSLLELKQFDLKQKILDLSLTEVPHSLALGKQPESVGIEYISGNTSKLIASRYHSFILTEKVKIQAIHDEITKIQFDNLISEENNFQTEIINQVYEKTFSDTNYLKIPEEYHAINEMNNLSAPYFQRFKSTIQPLCVDPLSFSQPEKTNVDINDLAKRGFSSISSHSVDYLESITELDQANSVDQLDPKIFLPLINKLANISNCGSIRAIASKSETQDCINKAWAVLYNLQLLLNSDNTISPVLAENASKIRRKVNGLVSELRQASKQLSYQSSSKSVEQLNFPKKTTAEISEISQSQIDSLNANIDTLSEILSNIDKSQKEQLSKISSSTKSSDLNETDGSSLDLSLIHI